MGPGSGFEPEHRAPQTNKTPTVSCNLPSLKNGLNEILGCFRDFLKVDLRLQEVTVKEHICEVRRFLAWLRSKGLELGDVSREVLREYLKRFSDMSPYTYKNVLSSLKRFFRDFLCRPELVSNFKFPSKPFKVKVVPSREEIKRFYNALEKPIEKALFLLYATTGLRKREVLRLRFEDVDFDKRMIIPNNGQTRTKRRWVTFYNVEAERALREYLASVKKHNGKLFRIGDHSFIEMWRKAYLKTGIKITPQVLREWFCMEMAKLGVPDRYVDAFCGRVPRSVLARHYTDYSPEKLREVYEKANLKVLG